MMDPTPLPMNVLYTRDSAPVAAVVTKRFDPMAVEDPDILMFLVTATLIYGWVYVKVGDVRFKTVLAMLRGPIRTPQLSSEEHMLFPLHKPEMVYPQNEAANSIHIIADPENAKAKKKFIRLGLWYSQYFAGGPPIGYNGRLYIVPNDLVDNFIPELNAKGVSAIEELESFPDLFLDLPESEVIWLKEFGPKKWWQFWK